MTNFPEVLLGWQRSVLLMWFACLALPGQELTLLGGGMNTGDFKYSSYSWQVDYRQDFTRNVAASVAYINEGHVPGHHRDGTAFEAWARLPFATNRFTVSLGLGAYYYYDTQWLPSGETANIHGTAPIFSVAASGRLWDRWLFRAMLNRTNPAHQMKVNTAVAGVGYWFGQEHGQLGDALEVDLEVRHKELPVGDFVADIVCVNPATGRNDNDLSLFLFKDVQTTESLRNGPIPYTHVGYVADIRQTSRDLSIRRERRHNRDGSFQGAAREISEIARIL